MPCWWLSFAATAREIAIEDGSHSHIHERLVSHSAHEKRLLAKIASACDWGGVAGFEPAASSSRSQRATSPTATLTRSDLPCAVHGRPLESAGSCGG